MDREPIRAEPESLRVVASLSPPETAGLMNTRRVFDVFCFAIPSSRAAIHQASVRVLCAFTAREARLADVLDVILTSIHREVHRLCRTLTYEQCLRGQLQSNDDPHFIQLVVESDQLVQRAGSTV